MNGPLGIFSLFILTLSKEVKNTKKYLVDLFSFNTYPKNLGQLQIVWGVWSPILKLNF